MTKPYEIHNKSAGAIVASIVKPMLEAGGDDKDVLVLLESVVAGVVLATVKLGGDEAVVDVLMVGVKERLAEIRLTGKTPAGVA